MKAEQATQKAGNRILPVVIGVLGGLIVSIVFLLIFAIVMTMKDLPQNAVDPLACVSIAAGSLSGGFLTAKARRSKGLLYGTISGLGFFVVIWVTGALMREAAAGSLVLIKLLISLAFGCIGGVAGVNMKRNKTRI